MKREFMAYLDEHPAAAPEPARAVRSPYTIHLLRAPAFAFLAVFAILGGTSYAAEASLPNDVLYPVKTGVIEPVFIKGTALTKSGKARASTTLIARRLDEAHELLDRNQMDARSAAILEEALKQHTIAVHRYIDEASAGGEIEEALAVSEDLENTLKAHEVVLAAVSDDAEDADETVQDLIDGVSEDADEAEDASEEVEEVIRGTADDAADQYVAETQQELAPKLEELREEVSREDEQDELMLRARALFVEASAAYARGRELLDDQNEDAFSEFRDALQSAEQATIILKSREGK